MVAHRLTSQQPVNGRVDALPARPPLRDPGFDGRRKSPHGVGTHFARTLTRTYVWMDVLVSHESKPRRLKWHLNGYGSGAIQLQDLREMVPGDFARAPEGRVGGGLGA